MKPEFSYKKPSLNFTEYSTHKPRVIALNLPKEQSKDGARAKIGSKVVTSLHDDTKPSQIPVYLSITSFQKAELNLVMQRNKQSNSADFELRKT